MPKTIREVFFRLDDLTQLIITTEHGHRIKVGTELYTKGDDVIGELYVYNLTGSNEVVEVKKDGPIEVIRR